MWFPTDYDDAVTKFRQAVAPLGGQAGRWSVGPGLEVDHIYWPATGAPQRLYIIMSGVHGPETYTGHAVQMMFLSELWPRLKRQNAGVFMVHALNPYGFKHNKRCTEAGVNLNRNCSLEESLFLVRNPQSVELAARFIPREPLQGDETHLMRNLRRDGGEVWFADVSLNDFIRHVCMGQYESPEGLEFGGFGLEPQIKVLIARLRELLPAYRDIVFFDVHTGLGHRARLHMLTGDKAGCVDDNLFKEILRPAEDHDIYEYTPSHAPGFYPTYGSTNDLMAELTAAGQRMCALTMEFGTFGHDEAAQLRSLNVWMAEHQGSLHGYANAELEKWVKEQHLEKSRPSARDWRERVIHAARETFLRVLERSKHI